MKRLLIAASVLLAGATAHATQKTPTAVKTEVNAQMVAGVSGGITALTMNGILNDVADSYGGTLVSNTWTAAQTFHVSPIIETLTGYVYCNGLSACTANTQVPVGNLSGLGTNVSTFLATPTSANLIAALTDETGSGAAVFGTSPTISAPTISGHPTVEGVTSTGATGLGKFVFDTSPTITTPAIVGVTNASSATGGNVGEVLENHAAAQSHTCAGSPTPINITSVTVTAGDWDIHGAAFSSGGTASAWSISISTTSATHFNAAAPTAAGMPFAGAASAQFGATLYYRANVNAGTTYYLVISCTGSGSPSANGSIIARRIR